MTWRRIALSVAVLIACLASLTPAQAENHPRATLGFEVPGETQVDSSAVSIPLVPMIAPYVVANNDGKAIVVTDHDPTAFWGRLSLRSDVGDGAGYSRGFTTFEAMLPIAQEDKTLWFADVRLVNFDQENRWEYNLGTGYRWYSSTCDCVFGVNAFYDARKTDYHFYDQLGLGFEALTPCLEFRANGYWIVGQGHRVIGDSGFNTIGTANGNFILVRQQIVETALGGAEFEAGGRLPGLDRFCPRLYAAFYTYSAANHQTANGVRGRFEAQLTERITLHASIQNDAVFGTTVTGGLSIALGAPAYRTGTRGPASWDDVLRQPVHRDVNVVIHQTTITTGQAQPIPPPPPPPPPPEEPG